MIQRIQSVYLLISATLTALTLYFSICRFALGDAIYHLSIFKFEGIEENALDVQLNMGLLILLPFAAALIIWNIFQYKNRKRQLLFGKLTYLLLISAIVGLYFFINVNLDILPEGDYKIGYSLGFFLPVAALAFNILAMFSISKDEKLISSLDRLR